MGKKYISIEREGRYGTYRGGNLQYIDIVSESVNPDQGMIDIETAGEREMRMRVPGPYSLGGDVDIIVNPDNCGKFLWWVLGNKVTTPSGACYTHDFTSAQEIRSFSMNIAPAVQDGPLGSYAMRRVTGCAISSMSFEAVAREALTSTVSVMAKRDDLVADGQAPSFSSLRPFIFFEGTVTLNGVTVANVEAFRVTIENEIADDAYVLGERYIPGIRLQGITISGDMDLAFLDWSMYRRFWDGTAAGTGPTNSIASVGLALTMTGQATGCHGADANYKLLLDLPACYFDTTEANIDRRERIVQSLNFTCIYDQDDAYTLQATLINKMPLSSSTTTSTSTTSTTTTSTSTTSTSTTSTTAAP